MSILDTLALTRVSRMTDEQLAACDIEALDDFLFRFNRLRARAEDAQDRVCQIRHKALDKWMTEALSKEKP